MLGMDEQLQPICNDGCNYLTMPQSESNHIGKRDPSTYGLSFKIVAHLLACGFVQIIGKLLLS